MSRGSEYLLHYYLASTLKHQLVNSMELAKMNIVFLVFAFVAVIGAAPEPDSDASPETPTVILGLKAAVDSVMDHSTLTSNPSRMSEGQNVRAQENHGLSPSHLENERLKFSFLDSTLGKTLG